ncbi:MAG: ABC transporter permease, partial [Flammeovirgaceae bacterium]|nr:ABC transporter permease [Flammeovirgaceae bacterium]
MSQQLNYKTPIFYAKKRLLKNKPAVFGFILIVVAHIVAALGYLIMPDNTPFANDGAVQIQKRTPGFSVGILKIRKNMAVEKVGVFDRILNGQESEYTIVPIIGTPKILKDSIYFRPHGREIKEVDHLLLNCVKPLFVGPSNKLGKDFNSNYKKDGDNIIYLDSEEKICEISQEELEKEFWENNVEKRTYLLGTDKSGRDMLSRLLYGTRISLSIGFISLLISIFVGVTFGAIAGFFGGKVDHFIMWIMTVIWSIPTIMLVIAISLALQNKGVWVAFVAVGLTMWVEFARVVRGQIMGIKQKLFIEAARALGFSNRRIIFYHILPNIIGPIVVISTSNFAMAILIEAGLSFLGLGVQPPTPSWGMMINEGFRAIGTSNSWHLVLLPSLCISFMVLAFNLLGNGLRDAFDPQGI